MALEDEDVSGAKRRFSVLSASWATAGRGCAIAALALCSAAGCAVDPPGPPMSNAARQSRVTPATMMGYVLAPGDDVEISFYRTPELNQHQLVRPDGGISLIGTSNPNARDMRAADLTVAQLREALAQVYGSELKNPDVTVTVRTFGSNTVYVMGEVGHPGMLPLSGSMTALQAITAAEGFKSSARTGDVLLIRPMGQGHASWQILNLGKGLGSADFTDDLRLAPHDILYVPRSPIGNVDEFVDLYIRRLLPIQPGIQVPVS